MTTGFHKPNVKEILDRFFYASDKPDMNLLNQLIAEYPEYRDALNRFAVTWELSEVPDEDTAYSNDVNTERLDRFQTQLLQLMWESEQRPASSTNQGVRRAMEALATIQAGGRFEGFARRSGLAKWPLLALKLVLGVIKQPPPKLVGFVADFIGFDRQCVATAIAEYAGTGIAMRFKAEQKPNAQLEQETWEDAVRSLGASEEDTRALLDLAKE